MKTKLRNICMIALMSLVLAVPAAPWDAFAVESEPQPAGEVTPDAQDLYGDVISEGDSEQPEEPEMNDPQQPGEEPPEEDPTQPIEPTQPTTQPTTTQPVTTQPTTTTKPTTAPTTTTAPKPPATIKTYIKSVTTKHKKSYKKTIKDTITVSPAYGRTVKLYFYDPYKKKWIEKKSYKTANKKTAKVKIKYPKLWKAYSSSDWKIVCPQYRNYKKASKTVTIKNKIANTKAAIILDGETGAVLYAQNARKHLKIASMTKMVTMMVAVDNAKPKQKVTITKEAVEARKMSGGMGLVKGDVIYMKDLEHATLMESANDAAAAAACGVSGTQKDFAVLMEKKARSVGATETTFEYAFGDWHSDTYSTAYDQALIGRTFMTDPKYKDLRAMVKKRSYSFKTLKNNKNYTVKMGEMSTQLIYKGRSIGIKSGCNPPAGYCYANAWKHDGKLYISIVMGAKSSKKLVSAQKALMKFGDYTVDHKGSRIKVK